MDSSEEEGFTANGDDDWQHSKSISEDDKRITTHNKAKGSGSDSKLTPSSSDVSGARESHSEHTAPTSTSSEKHEKEPADKEAQKQRDKDKEREGNNRKRERGSKKTKANQCSKNAEGDVRGRASGKSVDKSERHNSEILGCDVKTTCRLQCQIVDTSSANDSQHGGQSFSETSNQEHQSTVMGSDSGSNSLSQSKRKRRGKRRRKSCASAELSSAPNQIPDSNTAENDESQDSLPDSSNDIDSSLSVSHSDFPIVSETDRQPGGPITVPDHPLLMNHDVSLSNPADDKPTQVSDTSAKYEEHASLISDQYVDFSNLDSQTNLNKQEHWPFESVSHHKYVHGEDQSSFVTAKEMDYSETNDTESLESKHELVTDMESLLENKDEPQTDNSCTGLDAQEGVENQIEIVAFKSTAVTLHVDYDNAEKVEHDQILSSKGNEETMSELSQDGDDTKVVGNDHLFVMSIISESTGTEECILPDTLENIPENESTESEFLVQDIPNSGNLSDLANDKENSTADSSGMQGAESHQDQEPDIYELQLNMNSDVTTETNNMTSMPCVEVESQTHGMEIDWKSETNGDLSIGEKEKGVDSENEEMDMALKVKQSSEKTELNQHDVIEDKIRAGGNEENEIHNLSDPSSLPSPTSPDDSKEFNSYRPRAFDLGNCPMPLQISNDKDDAQGTVERSEIPVSEDQLDCIVTTTGKGIVTTNTIGSPESQTVKDQNTAIEAFINTDEINVNVAFNQGTLIAGDVTVENESVHVDKEKEQNNAKKDQSGAGEFITEQLKPVCDTETLDTANQQVCDKTCLEAASSLVQACGGLDSFPQEDNIYLLQQESHKSKDHVLPPEPIEDRDHALEPWSYIDKDNVSQPKPREDKDHVLQPEPREYKEYVPQQEPCEDKEHVLQEPCEDKEHVLQEPCEDKEHVLQQEQCEDKEQVMQEPCEDKEHVLQQEQCEDKENVLQEPFEDKKHVLQQEQCEDKENVLQEPFEYKEHVLQQEQCEDKEYVLQEPCEDKDHVLQPETCEYKEYVPQQEPCEDKKHVLQELCEDKEHVLQQEQCEDKENVLQEPFEDKEHVLQQEQCEGKEHVMQEPCEDKEHVLQQEQREDKENVLQEPFEYKEHVLQQEPYEDKEHVLQQEPCEDKEHVLQQEECEDKEHVIEEPCEDKEHVLQQQPFEDKEHVLQRKPCKDKENVLQEPCEDKEHVLQQEPYEDKEHVLQQEPCEDKEHVLQQNLCEDKEHVLQQEPCEHKEHLQQEPCEDKEHVLQQGPCQDEEHVLQQEPCQDKEHVEQQEPHEIDKEYVLQQEPCEDKEHVLQQEPREYKAHVLQSEPCDDKEHIAQPDNSDERDQVQQTHLFPTVIIQTNESFCSSLDKTHNETILTDDGSPCLASLEKVDPIANPTKTIQNHESNWVIFNNSEVDNESGEIKERKAHTVDNTCNKDSTWLCKHGSGEKLTDVADDAMPLVDYGEILIKDEHNFDLGAREADLDSKCHEIDNHAYELLDDHTLPTHAPSDPEEIVDRDESTHSPGDEKEPATSATPILSNEEKIDNRAADFKTDCGEPPPHAVPKQHNSSVDGNIFLHEAPLLVENVSSFVSSEATEPPERFNLKVVPWSEIKQEPNKEEVVSENQEIIAFLTDCAEHYDLSEKEASVAINKKEQSWEYVEEPGRSVDDTTWTIVDEEGQRIDDRGYCREDKDPDEDQGNDPHLLDRSFTKMESDSLRDESRDSPSPSSWSMWKKKPLWRKVIARLKHPRSYRKAPKRTGKSSKQRTGLEDLTETAGTPVKDGLHDISIDNADDGWKTLDRDDSPLTLSPKGLPPNRPVTNISHWRRTRRLNRLRKGAESIPDRLLPSRRHHVTRNSQRLHAAVKKQASKNMTSADQTVGGPMTGKRRKKRTDLLLHGHIKEVEMSHREVTDNSPAVFEVFCDKDKQEVVDLAGSLAAKETPTVRLLMKPLMTGMTEQASQKAREQATAGITRSSSPTGAGQLIDETTQISTRPSKRFSCAVM